MKKPAIIFAVIVLVVCVCVAVVAGVIMIRNNNQPKFTLIKEDGTVAYKDNVSNLYVSAGDETELIAGTFVKTYPQSHAQVILPDNSVVSLDEGTEIQINLSNNNVDIQQLVGQTWNRVETVTKGGSYTVTTPTTVAAVRGTIFGIQTTGSGNDASSQVYVDESNVEVSKIEKNGDQINKLETVTLGIGDHAQIVKNTEKFEIVKDRISDDFKNSDWYKRNQELNDIFQQFKDKKITDLKAEIKNKIEQRKTQIEDNKINSITSNSGLPGIGNYDFDNTQVCSQVNFSDIDAGIASLNEYSGVMPQYSNVLIKLLQTLKSDCSDGKLDANEINDLKAQSDALNQLNF